MQLIRRIGKKQAVITVLALLVVAAVCVPSAAMADQYAVITTVAGDWSSGAHSVVTVDPVGGPRNASNELDPSGSDMTVAAYGRFFYRMERSMADNITKYDVEAASTPIWQFSSEADSNPHDLVFLSEEKAYLLRYGTDTAWIVNPSATTEAEFKIGELDLSAYVAGDADGNPEMHSGVIVDGKLYITLQRIDFSGGWGNYVYNAAYVAVFDTATDQEIDTGMGNGGLLGIELPVINPGSIQYLAANQTIYVQGVGQYGVAYTGGIASIDPATYVSAMVLDDGDGSLYGNISGMAIVAPDKGYFVGYAGWGDNTLYAFDPSMATPVGTAVTGLENKSIAGMESGVYTDSNGMLWVCNQTDAQVDVLNTTTDTIDESVSTVLNPSKVVFASTPDPVILPPDSGDDDDDDDLFNCFINTLH
ncbi:MAG: hypothetical protein ABFS43_20395 [Thermodesulfobacteriota bacterium]